MSASRFLLSTVTGSCNLNSNPYRIDGTDQRKTQEKFRSIRYAVAVMAGIPGKSGPPGNQNAFRHGLAWISQRCVNGVLNSTEQSIREEILAGSLAEKGANFKARSFGI